MVTSAHDAPSPWQKSSFSVANGECVEVAFLSDDTVGIRDSKHAEGPVLRFSRAEFRAFVQGIQQDEFQGFC